MKLIYTHLASEGFHGVLYCSKDKKSVIITLSGSNGGMKMAQDIAHFYCRNGISAFALGYFKTSETSSALSSIPLEYIEKAIAWLKGKGFRSIGIDGISKGSEYALISAARFSDLSCVIVRAPSHYISEGLSSQKQPSGTSCWSYENRQLPYTPYVTRDIDLLGAWKEYGEFNLLKHNSEKTIVPESVICVENIKAPILLISTESDSVWPSAQSARCIETRLTECKYNFPHCHVCYKYISHFLVPNSHVSAWLLFKSERQFRKECAAERKDMNARILKWVTETWIR